MKNEDVMLQVISSAGGGLMTWIMNPILSSRQPVKFSMKSLSVATQCFLLTALNMIDEDENFEVWKNTVMRDILDTSIGECARIVNMSKKDFINKYIEDAVIKEEENHEC